MNVAGSNIRAHKILLVRAGSSALPVAAAGLTEGGMR